MAGPLFKARLKIATATALRRDGYGILAARRLSQTIDDDAIDDAIAMAPENVKSAYAELNLVGDLGDGTLLEKILAFLESDLGQILIKLLLSLFGI